MIDGTSCLIRNNTYLANMSATTMDPSSPNTEEQTWLTGLRNGNEEDLERIFHRFYRYLTVTAYQLIPDEGKAQDLVQDLFFSLWTKRANLSITGSLKAYLRKAVVNRCIDEIRRNKRQGTTSDEQLPYQAASQTGADALLETSDLQREINQAVDSLPERCRAVFSLSRFHDLSNKEIAAKLGISVKTVENQMTKALKLLRKALASHLPECLLLLFLLNR
jgi:RNA polymerase sigma-70 factor (ECF subfamily)